MADKKRKIIAALLLGRERSVDFPGKNIYPVLGRPLLLYPILAAKNSRYINEIYLSTDSEAYKNIGREQGILIIDRPPELATKKALAEEAFAHGYRFIKNKLKKNDKEIELMVLLFCNAATILAETIDKGIEVLRVNPDYDSAVTVSCYNMWSPLRARKINEDGLLCPFVPFEIYGNPKTLNCDRDSQGDAWFADMGISIVSPHCLEDLSYGLLPQKWMGQKIYPLKQWGGCDVDFEWQIPLVEYWLRKHGFSENKTPYDLK